MNLKILGKDIPINIMKESEMINRSCWGEWSTVDQSINLNDAHKNVEDMTSTLVHESMHAIIDVLGIEMDENLEEVLVKQIEIMLKDNFEISLRNDSFKDELFEI